MHRPHPAYVEALIPSGKSQASFSARLDADWEDLVRRPATATLLLSLAARQSNFSQLDANSLVVAINSTRDDNLIRPLVAVAQEGGEKGQIAARILLKALRPLIARLARQMSHDGTPSDVFAHVATELYQVIRTLPLHRPGPVLANLRMELVGSLFGERRAHHPIARRAISTAVPHDDIEALLAARTAAIGAGLVDMGGLALPAEGAALSTIHTLEVLQSAEAAGLYTGEEPSERIELLEMLVWALKERVLTEGQARALANYGRIEAADLPQHLAAASRARQRGLSRLRCALPRYLAAEVAPEVREGDMSTLLYLRRKPFGLMGTG